MAPKSNLCTPNLCQYRRIPCHLYLTFSNTETETPRDPDPCMPLAVGCFYCPSGVIVALCLWGGVWRSKLCRSPSAVRGADIFLIRTRREARQGTEGQGAANPLPSSSGEISLGPQGSGGQHRRNHTGRSSQSQPTGPPATTTPRHILGFFLGCRVGMAYRLGWPVVFFSFSLSQAVQPYTFIIVCMPPVVWFVVVTLIGLGFILSIKPSICCALQCATLYLGVHS